MGICYEMMKYYLNNLIVWYGIVNKGKKEGKWEYYIYEGKKMYDIWYFDIIIIILVGVCFKLKGILIDFDDKGKEKSRSYVVECFEKYDCVYMDYFEECMFIIIWEKDIVLYCMNGFVKNYYDNGVV